MERGIVRLRNQMIVDHEKNQVVNFFKKLLNSNKNINQKIMKTGIQIIAEERKRHIKEKGFLPKDDIEKYSFEELAQAGVCYALTDYNRNYLGPDGDCYPALWPWEGKSWKPTPHDRVCELAKAGALIAAQIDVLNGVKEPKWRSTIKSILRYFFKA